MRFLVSMHEIAEPKVLIEGATGYRYMVHVRSLVSVYGISGKGRITAPGRFP